MEDFPGNRGNRGNVESVSYRFYKGQNGTIPTSSTKIIFAIPSCPRNAGTRSRGSNSSGRLAGNSAQVKRSELLSSRSENSIQCRISPNRSHLQREPQGLEMRRIGLNACPYCGGSDVYASTAKTFWEKISVVLLLRHVRCDECRRRHFRPLFIPAPKRPPRSAVPREPPEIGSSHGTDQPRA